MNCTYCNKRLKADDVVIAYENTITHDGECFIQFALEYFESEPLSYIELLEERAQ